MPWTTIGVSWIGLFLICAVGSAISDKSCGALEFWCPCGKKNHVPVSIRMCDYEDVNTGEKLCVPCDYKNPFEIACSKFQHCETCSAEEGTCLSCPKGRIGKFCQMKLASTDFDDTQLTPWNQVMENKCQESQLRGTYVKCWEAEPGKTSCYVSCDSRNGSPEGTYARFDCFSRVGEWYPASRVGCEDEVLLDMKIRRRRRVSVRSYPPAHSHDGHCPLSCDDLHPSPSVVYNPGPSPILYPKPVPYPGILVPGGVPPCPGYCPDPGVPGLPLF